MMALRTARPSSHVNVQKEDGPSAIPVPCLCSTNILSRWLAEISLLGEAAGGGRFSNARNSKLVFCEENPEDLPLLGGEDKDERATGQTRASCGGLQSPTRRWQLFSDDEVHRRVVHILLSNRSIISRCSIGVRIFSIT